MSAGSTTTVQRARGTAPFYIRNLSIQDSGSCGGPGTNPLQIWEDTVLTKVAQYAPGKINPEHLTLQNYWTSKNKGKKQAFGYLGKHTKLNMRERKSDCQQTLTSLYGKRQYSKILKILERRKDEPRIYIRQPDF